MRAVVLMLALSAAALAGGCASTRQHPAPEPDSQLDAMNAGIKEVSVRARRGGMSPDYVIDPPDVLAIHVKDNPDLSATGIIVGPDGKISRPLIGTVQVAGRSVDEISAELKTRYSHYIHDADVTVMVTDFVSKFIYIDGEVLAPGRYPYTGNDSVVNALAQAGFLTRRASPNGIHVARGNPNDPEIYPVRLKDIIIDDDSRTNWLLEPDDIVYIPPSFMTRLGYIIEDIMFPIQFLQSPAETYATYQGIRDNNY